MLDRGLSPGEERLRDVLATRDARYGNRHEAIFLGAVKVLRDESNADRIAQSAHSMREIFEKLPKEYDGALTHVTQGQLKNQLDRILEAHRRVQSDSGSDVDSAGSQSGEINTSVQRLIRVVAEVAAESGGAASKSERQMQFMDDLDPLGSLPPDLKVKVGREWAEHERYFISVAHHGKIETAEAYADRMDAAVRFLGARLHPPIIETYARLDALIEKAESDA